MEDPCTRRLNLTYDEQIALIQALALARGQLVQQDHRFTREMIESFNALYEKVLRCHLPAAPDRSTPYFRALDYDE